MIPASTSVAVPQVRGSKLRALWPRRLPVIMGILNCTPDSFSDGGRFGSQTQAIEHGLKMVLDGADIIDIGGESTRPGALPVSATTEINRIAPVIDELRRRLPDTILSVDTCKAQVASAALEAGADLVNDVTAGNDIQMIPTVAAFGAGIVLMHMRGQPRTMQDNPTYDNAQAEVHGFLAAKAQQAFESGLTEDLVWLDPGIGFGKNDQANTQLLAALPDLGALGHPVVIGVSRKSMIARLADLDLEDRLPGSLAALTPAINLPRSIVRVHDPGPTLQFLRVLASIEDARQ